MATYSDMVDEDDTLKLLTHFVRTCHRIKSPDIRGETVMELCSLLFSKDYKFMTVPNLQGELCGHYPMKLIIMEYERDKSDLNDDDVESPHDPKQLAQMIRYARCARCWSRFVMPVILFEGKHVCRSATLSGAAEMFGRSTTDYLLSRQSAQEMGRTNMFGKFRGHDIELLKYFDVGYICDLMVEKKKTKFKMAITSSEKVDKENRYSDFTILGMPYPGCELFKDWKANIYNWNTTAYDWGLALNDSDLELPRDPIVDGLKIDWQRYKEWSLVEITQNYLKLLLQYLKHGTTGLLVHCISGWDRTPLFISLLRLSLWADGAIHKSLSAAEMLYLTLGYDWYLFGHDLPDRLSHEQEIMHFCFRVLGDISSDEFSVNPSPPDGLNATRLSPCATDRTGRQHRKSLPGQTQIAREGSKPSIHSPTRVNSDLSLGVEGVLLTDDLMSFPPASSMSSLNSGCESVCDGNEPINFVAGEGGQELDEQSERKLDGSGSHFDDVEFRGRDPVSRNQRRSSLSPPGQRYNNRESRESQHGFATITEQSIPVSVTRPGYGQSMKSDTSSDSYVGLSIRSNHFVGSPLMQHSSPVSVPHRQGLQQVGSFNSLGSWQVIHSNEHLKSVDACNNCSSPRQNASPIGSCNEAIAINMNSQRWRRLDTVSRLFQHLYVTALSSELGDSWQEPGNSNAGGGGALASIFSSLAEQVGLRSSSVAKGGGKQGRNSPRPGTQV